MRFSECLKWSAKAEEIKGLVGQPEKGSSLPRDSPSPRHGWWRGIFPTWREPHVWFPLFLAISRDVRCGCDFYALLCSTFSMCCSFFFFFFFYHLLWVSCHSVAFPLHSFSWAFTPTSSCWFISEHLVTWLRQRKGATLQSTGWRGGPQKASHRLWCAYRVRGEWGFF